MTGRNQPSGNVGVLRGVGILVQRIIDSPFAAWLLAALIGGGTATGVQLVTPDARNDPFTGSQGRDLARRLHSLEIRQSKDDDHRIQSQGGYERIRSIEREHAELRGKIDSMREELGWMRGTYNDHRINEVLRESAADIVSAP